MKSEHDQPLERYRKSSIPQTDTDAIDLTRPFECRTMGTDGLRGAGARTVGHRLILSAEMQSYNRPRSHLEGYY